MKASFEKVPVPADASFRVQVRDDARFDLAWRFHPEYELTLIVQSRGRRFVGDHVGRYGDGDLVLIGPDLPHSWVSSQGRRHRAIVIQFGRAFLGSGFFDRPELRRIDRLLRRAARGLQFLGEERQRAAQQILRMPRLTGEARLLTLLAILATLAPSKRVRPLAARGFVPSLRDGERAGMERACRYIEAHSARRIAPADVAAHLNVSVRTFSRLFKRAFRKTLTDYIAELRVARACALLIDTDRSISQACYAAGFGTLAQFNRQFRRLKGVTPSAYRHAHAG